ncbi:ABC transporter permease [Saccharopolyspora phatthalungensis]|uniref:Peptide/nickel transport system permease protein n=1 Tax=Saccharopolyspora phatthalungensis TaxID=664693 RepID=A0A840QI15_9PSEU|nr:ABC transporter permease [Saccharopolyspora phatthalungensis]MBB5159857.1 peptide/nickel transport system permease protein [Saccharopolyspora phatthalungensis]
MTTTDSTTPTENNHPPAPGQVRTAQPDPPRPARWTAATVLFRRPAVVLAVAVIAIIVLWAFLPGPMSPYDPLRAHPANALAAPSWNHWFGTDQLGRDVFSRVVSGAALTLQATLLAVAVGLVGGLLIGLVSGYAGGRVDAVLMRVVDVLQAFPVLLLAMLLVTITGFGSVQLSFAVGIALVGTVARVARSEVVTLRETTYVEASRSFGATGPFAVRRHVLFPTMVPVAALAVVEFGQAVLAIAALSFLGFGAPPPTAEWGAMVSTGQAYLSQAWWLAAAPGLVIAVLVISANTLSHALRRHRS